MEARASKLSILSGITQKKKHKLKHDCGDMRIIGGGCGYVLNHVTLTEAHIADSQL